MNEAISFDDVLLVPKTSIVNSRSEVDISSDVVRDVRIDVPIISANMPSVTDEHVAMQMHRSGGFSILHRFESIEDTNRRIQHMRYEGAPHYRFGVSFGLKDWAARIVAFDRHTDVFLLDVAHADSEQVYRQTEIILKTAPHIKLIVGNIVSEIAALRFTEMGVHGLKVGIGPGAACRTRTVTGFGMPQLQAISEVSSAVSELDVTVIADGGIRSSGDIVKALAWGADTVMIGKLIAATKDAPYPGEYFGNASRYVNGHNAPEGEHGSVEVNKTLKELMKELSWGIKSGVSYGGGKDLETFRQKLEFVTVTPTTLLENATRF